MSGTVLSILWHYGMQALMGLGLAFLLALLWYEELPIVLGLFVALGYALGRTQSYAIGKQWQDSNAFSLGDIGLTFGALGLDMG